MFVVWLVSGGVEISDKTEHVLLSGEFFYFIWRMVDGKYHQFATGKHDPLVFSVSDAGDRHDEFLLLQEERVFEFPEEHNASHHIDLEHPVLLFDVKEIEVVPDADDVVVSGMPSFSLFTCVGS